MKSGTLLVMAILAPGLLCFAQNQEPAATPSAVATPVQPAAAAAAGDAYVIGGNDELTITVWREPTLSGTFLVRPDGMISIPLVGDVQAAGLTPLHLADQITAKLKKYVQDPNVSVVVAQIHSKIVYMIGEVGKTGPVAMTPDMTLLEAISSAGGLTEFANKKKIYILRDEGGKRQRIPVHYKEALAGNLSLDLPLKPGDTIVVP
jgi:polysaccharide export outer membrane protein